jgi:hypothetical protein
MSRNAFVPMSWITSDLNGEALRTLILLSTYADNKTGECWPTNSELAKACRKSERSIRNDIHSLVESGMISIVDFNGRRRKIRIESTDWFSRPGRNDRARVEENLPVCMEENLPPRPEENLPPRKPRVEEKLPCRVEENLPVCVEEKLPPLIRTHPFNSPNELREEERSVSEESKPTDFAGECLSALSDLGRKPAPIPAEIKRMATDVNAEAWIGQLQFQEIPLEDWRVCETLTRIKARGGNKGVNYAWTIFRDLPEKKPEPTAQANGHVNGTPRVRKPAELVGAEAGLAMARRALTKGETDQAEVDRYEAKVEDLKRKAGIA